MKLKKIFSVLICMVMLFPTAALAGDSDIVLDEINLVGMTKPVRYQEVKKPTIRENSGNNAFSFYSGNWHRAADKAIVYTGNKFDSGTEYYYTFEVCVSARYVISPECVFKLDGETIPAENIRYSKRSAYITTRNYMTEGKQKQLLEEITLNNVTQPACTDSPSKLFDRITVPEGAPYTIRRGWWSYKQPDGSSSMVWSDFYKGDQYSLTLALNLDDGYITSYTNTKVFLPGSVGTPNSIRVSGVLTNPDKDNPYIVITYTVKQPESKKITLDANGGTFTNQSGNTMQLLTDKNGQITFLPDNTDRIYKQGCYLIGWFTQKTGGERVDTSKLYTADTTLYAHWGEIIDEVRLYTVMPMPGREPVLFKLGGDAYSVSQYWQTTDEEMLAFSDDEAINTEAAKQNILLTQFKKSKFYRYYAEITSAGDKQFTNETKIYLNNQRLENGLTYPSERLTVSESYVAAERNFEVFGGAVEIPAGICGSAIRQIDLNNYISSSSGTYTVTADNAFAAYGLQITDNRYITGRYKSTESDEQTFTLTVTNSSGTSKYLPVHIGNAQKKAFIEAQTKEINTDCGTAGGAATVKVCTPSGVTPVYDWQRYYVDEKKWYSISLYKQLLPAEVEGYSGHDTAALVINGNTKSALLKCVVKVGSTTLESNTLKYNVSHNYQGYSPNDINTHNRVCADCGNTAAENHVYKFELVRKPTGTAQGSYEKTCVRCGYSIGESFSASGEYPVFQLFITNKTSPDRTARCAAFTENRPLSYNPSRSGYTFLGWTVDKESQTPDYSPEENVFITDKSLSLYAVWGQNITAVGGKSINTQNTGDVFGDGSVLYTPQTAKNNAVLTLENAHITSYPITGVSSETGIYTNSDIEIMLVGDNVIETENENAIGILSDGNVTFSGDGSLTVRAAGSGYYATGVKAKNIDVYSKGIYITDSRTAFSGATALCNGVTEIYAGNYTGNRFKAFSQAFTEDTDTPMCIIGTADAGTPAAKLSGAADAVNAKYVLIAPENKPLIHYNADRKSIISVCSQSSTLVLASYDETGKITDTKALTQNFANKEISVTELAGGSKIFLWESLSTLKPLCGAFTVK